MRILYRRRGSLVFPANGAVFHIFQNDTRISQLFTDFIRAFEIAPAAGAKAQGSPTTVNEPLGGKIMASAGPLNSALALP